MSIEVGDVDLEAMKYQKSSTPMDERPKCPECGGPNIEKKQNRLHGEAELERGKYRCHRIDCQAHFDQPVRPEDDRSD